MAYKGLNLLSLFWNNFKFLVGSLQERNSFYGQKKAQEKKITCPLPPLLKCNGGEEAFFRKPDKIFIITLQEKQNSHLSYFNIC